MYFAYVEKVLMKRASAPKQVHYHICNFTDSMEPSLSEVICLNWFITQTVDTKSTKVSYKIVPATNFTV